MPRRLARPGALLVAAGALTLSLSAGCARPAPLFSEPNARAHLNMLAGTIGSRPVGTDANARARAYLIDQLQLFGFTVTVQETEARRPEYGLSAHVSNIIATKAGARPESIAVVAHYDSVAAGPGATDDGLGVVAALEAARVLAAHTDRRYSLRVILTDAEEAGLLGAAGLLNDVTTTRGVLAYLNLESIGSAGPSVLFETGPGNGWLVDSWARQAAKPRGSSYAIEIYTRLPNDTDFSILKGTGIPGLNFAPTDDSYAYHTARDTPDRLSPGTIQQTGENVVSLVTALDRSDLSQRSQDPAIFFDLGSRVGVSYPPWAGRLIAALAVLFGVAGGVLALIGAVRLAGLPRFLVTAFWGIVGALAAGTAMWAAAWLLRLSREVYHPWYAYPGRLFVLILVAGGAAAWLVSRAGALMPARLHALRHPVVVWALTLPVWTALAALVEWFAPSASYLWTIPLLTAGLLVTLTSRHPALVRLATVVILGVAGVLWIPDAAALLRFLVPVFGRLPIVTPEFVYPAALFMVGLMIVPPLVAVLLTRDAVRLRSSFITVVWLLALTIAGGLAYAAPAYTHDAPLRRFVRYVEDTTARRAFWEVASVEPGLDLQASAPQGWRPATDIAGLTVPIARSRYPFAFRTEVPPSGTPPGSAVAAITVADTTVELAVTATPAHAGESVTFVLPRGVTPLRSSLPGTVSSTTASWAATYMGVPMAGITLRAAFPREQAETLTRTSVVFRTPELPGGEGWQRLPSWLPQELAVWDATASYIVAPSFAPPPSAPAAP